jgi:hypothetical protein
LTGPIARMNVYTVVARRARWRAGVVDHRFDLVAMPHDAGVREQHLDIAV